MKFMNIEQFNAWYQSEEHGGFQLASQPKMSLAYMLYSIGWMSGYVEGSPKPKDSVVCSCPRGGPKWRDCDRQIWVCCICKKALPEQR